MSISYQMLNSKLVCDSCQVLLNICKLVWKTMLLQDESNLFVPFSTQRTLLLYAYKSSLVLLHSHSMFNLSWQSVRVWHCMWKLGWIPALTNNIKGFMMLQEELCANSAGAGERDRCKHRVGVNSDTVGKCEHCKPGRDCCTCRTIVSRTCKRNRFTSWTAGWSHTSIQRSGSQAVA